METLYGILYALSVVISVIFLIRFWMTMSRIKDIRDYLLSQKQNFAPLTKMDYVVENGFVEQSELDELIAKTKKNQCIVYVIKTSKPEIWDKSDWDDVIASGKTHYFKLIHKNF